MKDLMNYAVAKIRAKESTFIDSNGFLRLSQARNTSEFSKLISEYGYEADENFDYVLSSQLSETYLYVKDAVKNGNFLYPLLLKYDLFNIGVYMKAELSKKEIKPENLPFKRFGNYDIPVLISCLRENKKGIIPDIFLKYFSDAKEIYLNTGDISTAQIYLDKHGYEYILEEIKDIKSDFIRNYFMMETDIKNLMFALRLKRIESEELIGKLLISGGNVETEKIIKAFHSSLSDLGEVFKKSLSQKSVDEAIEAFTANSMFSDISGILNENLKNAVDKTKLIPFGTDPIIAFVLKKETEIEKLRLMYYKILAEKQ